MTKWVAYWEIEKLSWRKDKEQQFLYGCAIFYINCFTFFALIIFRFFSSTAGRQESIRSSIEWLIKLFLFFFLFPTWQSKIKIDWFCFWFVFFTSHFDASFILVICRFVQNKFLDIHCSHLPSCLCFSRSPRYFLLKRFQWNYQTTNPGKQICSYLKQSREKLI